MAGFYEGEGSISNDISNSNRIRLSISQNDPTPLIMAKEIWGGNIKTRTRKSPASDKMCTGSEWRLCHNKSLKFIEDIKPYMIIPYKITQITNAINISNEKFIRRFNCKYCDKNYASPSGRRRHEKRSHLKLSG